MTEQSIRNGALLKSGTLSPNPWDLALSGQNGWFYTGRTRTADKAPQGCDLSANSSAGMATGGFDAEVALNSNSTRRTLAYCGPKMVLTTGSTLSRAARIDLPGRTTKNKTPRYLPIYGDMRAELDMAISATSPNVLY